MNKRHSITETRDWSKIVLKAGIAVAVVIMAIKGNLDIDPLAALRPLHTGAKPVWTAPGGSMQGQGPFPAQ